MARFLKDRFFWYIVALLGIASISAYLVEPEILSGIPSEPEKHSTHMVLLTFRSGLLLLAVLITAWRFGVKGGMAIVFAIGLLLLPHIIDEMIKPIGQSVLAMYGIGAATGVAFSWLVGTRKQAEKKLLHAAKEWRTTFDSITDWVSIHDKDYKILKVNKAFADAFKTKPKELIGKTCYEVMHGIKEPRPDCPHEKTLRTKKPAKVEYFEPRLGVYLEVSTSPIFDEKGEVIASVHLARDITERKRMDEKLIMTDRLASIGEMASGIAHELNNPLTGVIGFSELLLGEALPDNVRKDLKVIRSEARRAARVVKNLLAFAQKHATVKELVSVNSIIEKVLELRAYEQKINNIQVITHFASSLPEVMADYFQLQQVFLNIIINAEYFMTEAHNKGTLAITTQRVGNIIRASFTNNGPGISEEDLGHVFDPFFTTKEVGKGTGLGLSICHGIVTEHGGRIYAKRKLGKGATFVVELPVANHQ